MTISLQDICVYVKGKVYVKNLTNENYISTENMLPNKAGITTATTLPNTLQTQIYQKNDILISNIRPYFKKIWYADKDGGCSNDVLVIRAKDGINSKFLYYVLAADDFFEYSMATSKGTKMPRGDKTSIMSYVVPDYDSVTQHRIASILTALDDKIALNTAINENLEQQSYLLLEHMLSAPHDHLCCLSDIANINPRYTLSKGTKARYIDMSQLSTTTSFPNNWAFRGYNGGMKFRNKDTIMARITPCLENGKTAYIDFLTNDEIAFGSTEYIVLSPKNNTPPELLYCIVRYPEFRNYATVNMNGSSGRQRVSGEIIGKYELPLFSQDELAHFRSVVEPLFKQITENSLQNRNLSALRDTLLPKLMNGEIDVSAVKI